ncbi:MAG: heparinase II/III family protein [Victivallales bacterium]|nr:heparinase II/III family protein [Victivallales bacterium]
MVKHGQIKSVEIAVDNHLLRGCGFFKKIMFIIMSLSFFIFGPLTFSGDDADDAKLHPYGFYKAADIARAKENIRKHKWTADVLGGFERGSRFWMNCPDDKLSFWIPDQGGWRSNCPRCGTPGYTWKLSPEGDKLICKNCGLVFPDNPEFRENKSYTMKDPTGKLQTINYYEGKVQFHNSSKTIALGNKYYLQGVIRSKRLNKLRGLVCPAYVYALTGKLEYAEKVRKVLLRFAEVYPHYIPKFRCKPFESYEANFIAGKVADWKLIDSEFMIVLANAYDLTLNSGVYSKEDRKKIENGIFREYKKLISAYMTDGTRNARPFHYAAAVLAGIILKDRELVALAVDEPSGYRAFIKKYFHKDGHWCENSPGYEQMALRPLNIVPEVLKDNIIFKDYDLSGDPLISKIFEAAAFVIMPNGALVPVNDSGFAARYPRVNAEANYFLNPTEENKKLLMAIGGANINENGDFYSLFRRDPDFTPVKGSGNMAKWRESLVRPGPGWAILRTSASLKDAAVVLNYGTIDNSHSHHSVLNFIYYDFFKELVTDLGYLGATHSNESWLKSPLAHNNVIVNGSGPAPDACGQLETFSCGGKVKAIIASANNSYEATKLYRRQVMFVDKAPGKRYLIDFFAVDGGKDHQYTFHADGENFIPPQLDWKPQDPKQLGTPQAGYKWLRDCKSASSADILSCTWVSDPKSGIGTKIWMLPDGNAKLIYGEAPGLRNRRRLLDKVKLFPVIFQRPGPRNVFLNVIECFRGVPAIRKIEALAVKTTQGQVKALKIDSGDTLDLVLIADEKAYRAAVECPAFPQLKFKGRMGFISLKNNQAAYMWCLGGTISWGKQTVGQGEISGKIIKVDHSAKTALADAVIPGSVNHEYLMIPGKFDGVYKIMGIEKSGNGKTLIKFSPDEIVNIAGGDNFRIIPWAEKYYINQ